MSLGGQPPLTWCNIPVAALLLMEAGKASSEGLGALPGPPLALAATKVTGPVLDKASLAHQHQMQH